MNESATHRLETSVLGMWTFLATEVLFFGGLFLAYTAYRSTYPEIFGKAGRELNVIIGTINTAVLLTSSYTMALAVHTAQEGKRSRSALFLAVTWILGACFMMLKAYEYFDDAKKHLIQDASSHGAKLFYLIYYTMTGLHATHVTIGLGVIAVMWIQTLRGSFSKEYSTPVELTGLYWHFVDLVWIFLYPLLYLIDRHSGG